MNYFILPKIMQRIMDFQVVFYMRDYNLYDIFKRNSFLYQNKVAVVNGTNRLTFIELLSQTNKIAFELQQRGVVKGDTIAIIAFNSPYFFSIYGVAAALGLIVVPINWRLSNEEITHILNDCTPFVLFFDIEHQEMVSQISVNNNFKGITIGFDEVLRETNVTDDSIINKAKITCTTAGVDPFLIIYTAAVDGETKGAVLSHNNIFHGNLQTVAALSLTDKDAYLNMLPMFHIIGISLAFSVMHQGGKNIIMKKFNGTTALELIEKNKVSVLGSFPPILSALQDEMEKKSYNLSTLTHTLGIDSKENINLFEEKTKSNFWVLYGQTETSGIITLSPSSEKPGSAGRPGILTKIKLVDQQDRDLPVGTTGEIVVQGPMVFQGFWKNNNENKYIFRNGWHHTGDIGYLDNDGYLWFKGRKPEKELIKPGGENVYPKEVENTILKHKDISEVTVIGVPDLKFGEAIKAVCVLKNNSKLAKNELIEFVASHIARYKKPKYVEFITQLPKTHDGSIDRGKVKELYGIV